MELADYWHFLRKWIVLIATGTLLSANVGYGVVRLHHATPSYGGAASVLVHYVAPFGAPYNATLSPRNEAVTLKRYTNDPATLRAVARQYHVRLDQIASVTAIVDPDSITINVTVVGRNPVAVDTVAYGIATYLANLESTKVQKEARTLQQQVARQVKSARARWFAAQVHGNLVSRQSPTFARLQANLAILQQDYQALFNQYEALGLVPLPAATVERSRGYTIVSTVASPTKTVLPVTALGFLLTLGLAALLDYVQSQQMVRMRPARRGPGAAYVVKTPSNVGAPE
jgi:hypothetical protein